jgi:hypothetical protein
MTRETNQGQTDDGRKKSRPIGDSLFIDTQHLKDDGRRTKMTQVRAKACKATASQGVYVDNGQRCAT